VTAAGAVRSYNVKGRLPRGLTPGVRVRFVARGATAYRVHTIGRVRKLQFYGRVMHSGRGGAVLRLGDGRGLQLTYPAQGARKGRHGSRHKGRPRAHLAPDVTISFEGLRPGQTVLITLTLSPTGDSVAITIKLVDATGSAPAVPTTSQQLSGTVTALDATSNSFTVTDASGNDHDFTAPDSVLLDAAMQECDLVDVSYHQTGDQLTADDVHVTGADTTGACADSSTSELEAIGTISALDTAGVLVTITTDDGQTLNLVADPSLLDGLAAGQHVDVLYSDSGDGTLTADDIQTD
jgi:hypothetical protein